MTVSNHRGFAQLLVRRETCVDGHSARHSTEPRPASTLLPRLCGRARPVLAMVYKNHLQANHCREGLAGWREADTSLAMRDTQRKTMG